MGQRTSYKLAATGDVRNVQLSCGQGTYRGIGTSGGLATLGAGVPA